MGYLKEGKGKTSENFKSGKDGADRKSYDLDLECVCVCWGGGDDRGMERFDNLLKIAFLV